MRYICKKEQALNASPSLDQLDCEPSEKDKILETQQRLQKNWAQAKLESRLKLRKRYSIITSPSLRLSNLAPIAFVKALYQLLLTGSFAQNISHQISLRALQQGSILLTIDWFATKLVSRQSERPKNISGTWGSDRLQWNRGSQSLCLAKRHIKLRTPWLMEIKWLSPSAHTTTRSISWSPDGNQQSSVLFPCHTQHLLFPAV